MYYVTPTTAAVLDRGLPQLVLTKRNWKAIAARFALKSKRHFQGVRSLQQFASSAFLPQSPASFRALVANFANAPESIYVLNLRCVHCRSLYQTDDRLTPSVVVWLNAGETHVPASVCTLFALPQNTTAAEFYRKVPFPHNLAALSTAQDAA